VPFVSYRLVDGATPGTKDLLVYDLLSPLNGLLSLVGVNLSGNTTPSGYMRVENYRRGGDDGAGNADRYFSRPGDLRLSFEDTSPLALLSAIAPSIAGIPIAQSVFVPTTERQLAPMFEAIFRGKRSRCAAAAFNDNDAWPVRPFHFDGWEKVV
jgi:hypothetical protein